MDINSQSGFQLSVGLSYLFLLYYVVSLVYKTRAVAHDSRHNQTEVQ